MVDEAVAARHSLAMVQADLHEAEQRLQQVRVGAAMPRLLRALCVVSRSCKQMHNSCGHMLLCD